MSADNGIYILECKDQYRVIHAQAIENLYWTFLDGMKTTDHLIPTRIVEMYGKSKYTRNKDIARNIAFSMAERTPILEYGISTIKTNKFWNQIVREAKELAPKEIDAIGQWSTENDNRWGYYAKELEEIINM